MQNWKNPWFLSCVVFCMVLGWVAWSISPIFVPQVKHISAKTYSEFIEKAGSTLASLPPTARQIRYVSSIAGLRGSAQILKFSAPEQDLKEYALYKFSQYHSFQGTEADFTAIVGPPLLPDLSLWGINDLKWFNLESISNGVELDASSAYGPTIWIDLEKEELFYIRTD